MTIKSIFLENLNMLQEIEKIKKVLSLRKG